MFFCDVLFDSILEKLEMMTKLHYQNMSKVEGFWVGFWIFGLIMKNEEFPCFEFGGKNF